MNPIPASLSQLEARLQALIEGGLARLFPGSALQKDLAHRLILAMQAGAAAGQDGLPYAPDLYLVSLPPEQAQALETNSPLMDELSTALQQAGFAAGLQFAAVPAVKIQAEASLPGLTARIAAVHSHDGLAQTSTLPPLPGSTEQSASLFAFLIVNGSQIVALSDPMVNLGRLEDNHIILDDPRVSRRHAQLRLIQGHYVLFDLGSTGGTFVNDQRVTECVLYPGDVISLAGVPLIYGQEARSISDGTQKLDPLDSVFPAEADLL